jgi:hypothetical protein
MDLGLQNQFTTLEFNWLMGSKFKPLMTYWSSDKLPVILIIIININNINFY